eukprot:3646574-Ditylum_brightwellii.AAC.1
MATQHQLGTGLSQPLYQKTRRMRQEVYECLLSLVGQTPTWIMHAKAFLHACVVKQSTRDPKAHINQTTYLCMAPPEAKKWTSHQFGQLHPVLPVSPAPQPQSTSTSAQAVQELLIQKIPMELQQYKTSLPPTATTETTQKGEDTQGISNTEFTKFLYMCGLK